MKNSSLTLTLYVNHQSWNLFSCCIFLDQAELQEVVGEDEDEDAVTVSSTSSASVQSSQAETPECPPLQVQHIPRCSQP